MIKMFYVLGEAFVHSHDVTYSSGIVQVQQRGGGGTSVIGGIGLNIWRNLREQDD